MYLRGHITAPEKSEITALGLSFTRAETRKFEENSFAEGGRDKNESVLTEETTCPNISPVATPTRVVDSFECVNVQVFDNIVKAKKEIAARHAFQHQLGFWWQSY